MFDKFKTAFELFRLVLRTSKKINLSEIQVKYGFNKERRIKITIHDAKRSFYMKLKEGKLVPLNLLGREYDNEIEFDRLYTLKYLVNGEKPVLSPRGELRLKPYALMDAWTNGELTSDGRASTNMVFCVVDVVTSCIRYIDADELDRIMPDSGDEYLQEVTDVANQKRKSFAVRV